MSVREARRRALAFAVLAACAAATPVVLLSGFTVDDAWIPVRVASRISSGFGHRFNLSGAEVDAVTPFGFAYLLAPAAQLGMPFAFYFAKWFGACAWILAAAWLGARMASRTPHPLTKLLLVPLAACAPLGAWAGAGLETGVVTALATLSLATSRWALAPAGLAAALRPELVPWACTLVFGRGIAARDGPARRASDLALVLAPALVVGSLRFACFGSPVPLAAHAKPSDLSHGLFYALGALLWCGLPFLLVAPRSLRRLGGDDRAVLAAVAAHSGALVLVGGDWMPFFRLFVPVLPSVLWVAASLVDVAPRWATLARVALATAVSLVLALDKWDATRGVVDQRRTLIAGAGPLLSSARRVATLDAGWVGAATDADIIDLAGVTDPEVAHLPGGHTSKRFPPHFLERRGADALVLLFSGVLPGEWENAQFGRTAEARIAREAAILGFVPEGTLELRRTKLSYVVLRLKNRP